MAHVARCNNSRVLRQPLLLNPFALTGLFLFVTCIGGSFTHPRLLSGAGQARQAKPFGSCAEGAKQNSPGWSEAESWVLETHRHKP